MRGSSRAALALSLFGALAGSVAASSVTGVRTVPTGPAPCPGNGLPASYVGSRDNAFPRERPRFCKQRQYRKRRGEQRRGRKR